MPTIYGQSDALAVAVTALINQYSGAFILPVTAQRLFVSKLGIGDIPAIGSNVSVRVIPGAEHADLQGLNQVYDDTYTVAIVILQNVTDVANGGLSEAQMQLLLQLRSQIFELLCMTKISCTAAVHPFCDTMPKGVRSKGLMGEETGVYDLARLESDNVFYSASQVIYPAVGIVRRAT